jgi:hypothetical protein
MLTERYQMCHDTPCAWGYPGIYYWAPMYAHYSQGRFQATPSQKDCDPALPQTPHPGGISPSHYSINLLTVELLPGRGF